MASKNKKAKALNSFCIYALKEKDYKMKRVLFYNSSTRKKLKRNALVVQLEEL